MVDNSLALGIKSPEIGSFNPLQAALVASQLRNAQTQNSLAEVQLQNAPAMAAAQLQGAQTNNALGQAQLQLAPVELGAKKLELENKTVESARLRDAEDGIRVLSTPAGAMQDAELKKVLDKAVAEGRTDPAHRDAILAMPVEQRNALLQEKLKTSLTPQQFIELQQKQADRQMGRDIAGKLKAAGLSGGASADAPQTDYFTTLKKAESSGNPNAKPPVDPATGKPASTADGLYQFTDGTWASVAKNNPDLGLTPEGRTDPAQQEKAVRALTAENSSALIKAGFDPSGKNLYMAHFLGADGAKTFLAGLKANPSAPAASLVSPEAATANKSVFFDSAGQPKTALGVYNSLTSRFGNDMGGAVAATTPLPGSVDPQAARMIAMLPTLRELRKAPGLPEATAKGIDEDIKYVEKIMEPTSDIKNYQLVVAQARAAGKTPVSFEDFQEASEKRKQQQVTVNAYANPLLKGISDQFIASRDKAMSAADDIRAIHLAREQVENGIIAGAGADWRLWGAKIGALFGVTDVDKIASTEAFSSQIGQRVVNIVKAFGSGTGISNADRDYAEKMAGGQIKLEEASIKRILDIGEKANRAMLERFNGEAAKITKELPEEGKHLAPLFPVSIPGAYKKTEAATGAPPPAAPANPYEAEMRRRGLLAGGGSASP